MKPYYEEENITIYLGNCLEIMPELEPVDLVLTDPPYENYTQFKYIDLTKVPFPNCKMLIFWSIKTSFPLNYTAVHTWVKPNGHNALEKIYEINGNNSNRNYRYGCINSIVSARMLSDIFVKHPTQKPIKLIRELLKNEIGNTILDPFMGSGTTLVAAKQLGRKAIGIEIEEKYCEIAVDRLRQGVFQWD